MAVAGDAGRPAVRRRFSGGRRHRTRSGVGKVLAISSAKAAWEIEPYPRYSRRRWRLMARVGLMDADIYGQHRACSASPASPESRAQDPSRSMRRRELMSLGFIVSADAPAICAADHHEDHHAFMHTSRGVSWIISRRPAAGTGDRQAPLTQICVSTAR